MSSGYTENHILSRNTPSSLVSRSISVFFKMEITQKFFRKRLPVYKIAISVRKTESCYITALEDDMSMFRINNRASN